MAQKVLQSILILSLLIITSHGSAFAGDKTLQVGDQLPALVLPVPADSESQTYLGLDVKENFTVDQIQAKLLIIEIFSMYCPFCQKDAPVVNRLYDKIQKDDHLRQSVKIIGIGAGNSEFEVNHFKKTYNVQFPLFPDKDFSIHKRLGQVRTPYFIGVMLTPDNKNKVIYAKLGNMHDENQFLKTILQSAQLKP